jgi:hypothetical protein
MLKKAPGRPHQILAVGVARLGLVSVDLTTAGETPIVTVPAGLNYIVTETVVRCTAAANVTTPASAGIGVAAGADDIFPSQQLSSLLIAGHMYRFPAGGTGAIAGPGDTISVGVDVAATGTSVTQTASVELIGYWLRT